MGLDIRAFRQLTSDLEIKLKYVDVIVLQEIGKPVRRHIVIPLRHPIKETPDSPPMRKPAIEPVPQHEPAPQREPAEVLSS